MATVSSLGIGTGVDLQSMLTKLIAAERAPIDALDRRIASTNTTISLYGQLRSKLDTLRTAANTLQSPLQLSAMAAASSDDKVATASASFLATPGSYAIDVVQLAAAQKSFTQAYASDTSFGQGQLNFTVGGTPHSIDLTDQASYTIHDLRGKINEANIGVTATVVSGSDGDRLILTGAQSGADHAFSFTTNIVASNGQASLDDLDTDPSLAHATARNGIITIDGITVSSSTNTFSGAVNGLTFTAKAEGTTTISVQTDENRITEAAKAFVDAYNEVVKLISSNSAYNQNTGVAQSFNADSAARSILGSLTSARTNVPPELSSATLKNLYEIGISIQQNGELTLDSEKLKAAVSTSSTDVTAVLAAYGNAFSNAVNVFQGENGVLTTRVNSLNATVRSFEDQQERLEFRVATIEASYRRQFTALDVLISQMTAMSSYLAQQLAGLSQNNR